MSAHQKLVALDATLKTTNWAGARACIVLVGDVDLLIARLFNKAEQVILRAQAPAAVASPQGEPPASSSADSSAESEIAAPDEEEKQ